MIRHTPCKLSDAVESDVKLILNVDIALSPRRLMLLLSMLDSWLVGFMLGLDPLLLELESYIVLKLISI